MQHYVVLHIRGINYSNLTASSPLHFAVAETAPERLRRDKLILDNYLIPCTT